MNTPAVLGQTRTIVALVCASLAVVVTALVGLYATGHIGLTSR